MWDLETGKPKGQFLARHSRPKSIAVSPDGKWLAVLTPEGKLQLLEPPGKLVREWQAETYKNVGSVAFSPDSKWLVSNGRNTCLWEVATGKLLRQFEHPPEPMGTLAFSPDGKRLCAGSMNGTIRLWDARTGKELGQLAGHTKYIDQVAFSPDGDLLASVSHDGTARLWSLFIGEEIRSVPVDHGVSLALSPDGRSMAAGGSTGVIKVWEIASGTERATFQSNSGFVYVLLFSPDGKTLISGHQNGKALCWDFTGLGPEQRFANKALAADDLELEWKHLGSDDAHQAFQAIWTLAAAGDQAVVKVQKELQPAKPADERMISQCIKNLNNDDWMVREKARVDLKKAGDQAWPALRRAFAEASSPETKRRAKGLLELQFNPAPDRLRLIRSLELLEHIKTKPARALLQSLANGAPNAWLTEEAKRILKRIPESD